MDMLVQTLAEPKLFEEYFQHIPFPNQFEYATLIKLCILQFNIILAYSYFTICAYVGYDTLALASENILLKIKANKFTTYPMSLYLRIVDTSSMDQSANKLLENY